MFLSLFISATSLSSHEALHNPGNYELIPRECVIKVYSNDDNVQPSSSVLDNMLAPYLPDAEESNRYAGATLRNVYDVLQDKGYIVSKTKENFGLFVLYINWAVYHVADNTKLKNSVNIKLTYWDSWSYSNFELHKTGLKNETESPMADPMIDPDEVKYIDFSFDTFTVLSTLVQEMPNCEKARDIAKNFFQPRMDWATIQNQAYKTGLKLECNREIPLNTCVEFARSKLINQFSSAKTNGSLKFWNEERNIVVISNHSFQYLVHQGSSSELPGTYQVYGGLTHFGQNRAEDHHIKIMEIDANIDYSSADVMEYLETGSRLF